MKTRIVKLQKGLFKVEYSMQSFSPKRGLVTEWITVEKDFTSYTRAETFIREKLAQYIKSHK